VFSEGLGPFLVRSVAGSGAVQLAGMFAAFLVGVQLARGLGVTGYGYYGIAMAVVTLATIPGTLGIPKLVTREVAAAGARKDLGALFGVLQWADRVCWRISAVVAIAMAIGAAIAWRTSSPVLGATILLGAPMIAMLPLIGIRGAALRGLNYIVLGQLSYALLRPVAMSMFLFAIFLVGRRVGAPTAMAANSVIAAAALLLTQWWLARRLPDDRPTAVTANSRGWFASTIPMALTDAVQSLQLQLSVLLLGIVTVPAQVGLFRVSTATAAVIVVPVTVVNTVVIPMFARLHAENDHSRLQRLLTSSALVQFAGVFLLSLPLLLAGGYLFGFVFGPEYAPAASTIRILAIGAIVSAAFGPNASLLNMTGHERCVTRAVSAALVVNLAVVAVLAPRLGSAGSACGVLAGQCCWNLMLWLDARRRLSLETSIAGKRLRTIWAK
jgi:O-antigen/teichoic acid export membrane protein